MFLGSLDKYKNKKKLCLIPCRERLGIQNPSPRRSKRKSVVVTGERLGGGKKPAHENSFLMRLKHDFWGIFGGRKTHR